MVNIHLIVGTSSSQPAQKGPAGLFACASHGFGLFCVKRTLHPGSETRGLTAMILIRAVESRVIERATSAEGVPVRSRGQRGTEQHPSHDGTSSPRQGSPLAASGKSCDSRWKRSRGCPAGGAGLLRVSCQRVAVNRHHGGRAFASEAAPATHFTSHQKRGSFPGVGDRRASGGPVLPWGTATARGQSESGKPGRWGSEPS